MKCVLLLALLMMPELASAQSVTYGVWGIGLRSCGSWINDKGVIKLGSLWSISHGFKDL